MRKQRESQDEGNNGQVIDTKVGIILTDTEGGLRQGFRLGEGGTIGKFRPGATLGNAMADRVRYLVDEGAEGWSSDGRLRLG